MKTEHPARRDVFATHSNCRIPHSLVIKPLVFHSDYGGNINDETKGLFILHPLLSSLLCSSFPPHSFRHRLCRFGLPCLGRHLLFGDFVPSYVRSILRPCLIKVKGAFKGRETLHIFQSILKYRNGENDKAFILGANNLLDEVNRCLQSSDFLGFATHSPMNAVLTAWTCSQ